MRSDRPKPLHMICGRAMVLHVIEALHRLRPATTVVVVGHHAEKVTAKISKLAPSWANITFVEQLEQRGTGDAAACGMKAMPGDDLDDDSTVVVLPGDTPLLRPETLDELVAAHVANDNAVTVLASVLDDPTGYGRIVRGADDRVLRIVEQRDASREEREIREVCTSIYAFRRDLLGPALRHLSPDNAQGEYYLTDVVGIAGRDGSPCRLCHGAGRRDPGSQRPLAAGARRARAAGAHESALVAQRGDDARSAPDVHRRHRRPRTRHHAVSRNDAPRIDRHRQPLRDRPEHPAASTARSAIGPPCSTPPESRRRSAPGPGSGRTPPSDREPWSRQTRSPGRSTLHSSDSGRGTAMT